MKALVWGATTIAVLPYILFFLCGLFFVSAAYQIIMALINRERDFKVKQMTITERADYEDMLWREEGIYEGQYPAETMPLTDGYQDFRGAPDWSKIIRPQQKRESHDTTHYAR